MDHSVQAYLERQPLEKLEAFLQEITETGKEADYAHIMPVFWEVLEKSEINQVASGHSGTGVPTVLCDKNVGTPLLRCPFYMIKERTHGPPFCQWNITCPADSCRWLLRPSCLHP